MRWKCLGKGGLVASLVLAMTGAVAAEPLRIAGTGSGVALMRILAGAYRNANPGAETWTPESVGSSGAIRGLEAGKLDVGIILRPLKAGELPGGRSVEICRTALVFFTAASRSDVVLRRNDLNALFSSTLPPFPRGEIRPLMRPPSETSSVLLQGYFPETAAAVEQARQYRGAVLALTDQDAMDLVEGSTSLVAFGALTPILAEHRKLIVVPFDGHEASPENIVNGSYPYWVPMTLVVGPNTTVQAAGFIDFARSAAAAPILHANGCYPVVGSAR